MKAPVVIAAAAVLGAALPGAYVAMGGGRSSTPPIADPCLTRDWRNPTGLERISEQIALSAFDGAACDLGVSREELVLGLASPASRASFARRHGLDDAEIERAARNGLLRAVRDARDAGAIGGTQAAILERIAEVVPVDRLLEAIGGLG